MMIYRLNLQSFDTNVIGQKTVNAVPNYFQKDTIYTFEISSHNNDEAIQKITERLGKPVSNSIGELVWEKISLPYIGKNLKIVLKDGAFTISNDRAEFVPFKDVASKEKLMNESSKNVLRKTEIFVFANGKNAILVKAIIIIPAIKLLSLKLKVTLCMLATG